MKIDKIRIGKEEYTMYAKTALLGTLSLKRDYQRNTLIGFGLAGGLHLFTAGIIAILMALSAAQVSEIPTIVIKSTTDIMPHREPAYSISNAGYAHPWLSRRACGRNAG